MPKAEARITTQGIILFGRRITMDRILSVLLILPSVVAIGVFVYGFIGWSIMVSLSRWQNSLNPDYTFDGFNRYLELFTDRRFAIDLTNTAIFTSLFLVACLGMGLILALLVDQRVRGEVVFRNIFLFPMAVSFIVTGVAWRWLMNPATGTRISGINLIFHNLGLDFLISRWMTTPFWGIAFVVIPAVWQMSGFAMAMYLAGLRSIPDELREAARVDGATEWQIFTHIVLPLLRPVTLSAFIVLGHISLKIFDLIVAISQNDIRLDVPAVYMWRATFDANNYSRGAAIGIIMLLTVAVLIVPYLVYLMRSRGEE